MKKRAVFVCLLLLSLAGGLFTTGCHLGQPASASFASVLIPGKTPDQIHAATTAVFQKNEYQEIAPGEGWTFEREATQGETFSSGGLYSARYGVVTLVRVRVKLVAVGTDTQRLQCQAYIVTDANDPLMTREIRLSNYRSGPYQDLLDEVAKRLSPP
jgi:hypothetical protein